MAKKASPEKERKATVAELKATIDSLNKTGEKLYTSKATRAELEEVVNKLKAGKKPAKVGVTYKGEY